MQIHELATLGQAPATGTYVAVDTGTATRKLDYTTLAQAVVEQYSGSTLAGSAQSIQAAFAQVGDLLNAMKNVPMLKSAGPAQTLALTDGMPGPVNALKVAFSSSEAVTGVTVTRTGVNLMSKMPPTRLASSGVDFTLNSDLSVTVNGTSTAASGSSSFSVGTMNLTNAQNYFPLLQPGSYVVPLPTTSNVFYRVGAIGADGTQIKEQTDIQLNTSLSARTFTLDRPGYIYFRVAVFSGNTADNVTVYPAVYPSGYEPTEWEPYQGETVTATFPAEAGTVTEGTVDFINGSLTVTGGTYAVTPQSMSTVQGYNGVAADVGQITMTYQANVFDNLS